MATIVVTGGTGTIGKTLCKMLVQKGFHVIILTRKVPTMALGTETTFALWDVNKGVADVSAITSADYIIHLAGANVAEERWTERRKREILESRIQSSQLLVKILRENENKVRAVISASATGWYGPDTPLSIKDGFKEDAKPAADFLGTTCRLWEESIEPVAGLGIRLVKLRTGIVLSNDGGAFVEFKKPLKAGLATIMGSGRQMVSWVHIDDICRIYVQAIENEGMHGVYNVVAPKPVTNKALILEIAKQVNGKWFIPVHAPSFALKMLLGEMSIEVLKSVAVNSEKIQAAGFNFLYPDIEQAVRALVNEA